VNEVLLGQLEQEVCAELDVEVKVVEVHLGLGDVEVEGLVQELDRRVFVLLVAPLDDCLKISVGGCLLLGLANVH